MHLAIGAVNLFYSSPAEEDLEFATTPDVIEHGLRNIRDDILIGIDMRHMAFDHVRITYWIQSAVSILYFRTPTYHFWCSALG